MWEELGKVCEFEQSRLYGILKELIKEQEQKERAANHRGQCTLS